MTVLFDHAGVESADIQKDARLYLEAFGLHQVRWGTHSLTGDRIAILSDAHGVKLELIEVPKPAGGRVAHLAFRTADLEATHAQAIGAGCSEEGEIRRIDAAQATSAMVRFPTGDLLQLIQYEPHSPDLAMVKDPRR